MRPRELWSYDYESENYTRLLWVMEGWTAYYDDLIVARAGRMRHRDYCAAMAKNVQGMRAAPGRFELSLEESSFDAWIRLYRPDENTRNSSQNYYGNGAVAAMCLDLGIRRATQGARSLDDVVRELWASTYEQGRGYELDDVHRAIREVASDELVERLQALVTGPLDPELDDLLSDAGIALQIHDDGKPFLGVALKSGTTRIASEAEVSTKPRDAVCFSVVGTAWVVGLDACHRSIVPLVVVAGNICRETTARHHVRVKTSIIR